MIERGEREGGRQILMIEKKKILLTPIYAAKTADVVSNSFIR
jgi:hypothetical protein